MSQTDTTSLRTYPHFLGEDRRSRLIEMLESCRAQWSTSQSLGKTGRGSTYQLAASVDRESALLAEMRVLVGSLVYQKVEADFGLPDPSQLRLQVFPVRMEGSPIEPPSQAPHVDGDAGDPPLVTSVYYAVCEGTRGGALALDVDGERHVIVPTEDTLVSFAGHHTHQVLDLTAGNRLSFVCNFYESPASARA